MSDKKTLLYHINMYSITILVPKKRGEGYLKNASGGHWKGDLSRFIETLDHVHDHYDEAGCTILEFTSKRFHNKPLTHGYDDLIREKIIKPIADHLGHDYREPDEDEFFNLLT